MDISYLAGFFDGEGCIGLYCPKKTGRYYALRTQLVQNSNIFSDKLFTELQSKYGGYIGRKKTSSGKIKLNWVLSNAPCGKLLIDILPHLIFKKEQAVLAMEWLKHRPPLKRDSRGRIMSLSENWMEYSTKVANQLVGLKE